MREYGNADGLRQDSEGSIAAIVAGNYAVVTAPGGTSQLYMHLLKPATVPLPTLESLADAR